MQHTLSVTGRLLKEDIPAVHGVTAVPMEDGVIFTAKSEEDMKHMKRSLALFLTDTIMDAYEGQFLHKFINTEYPQFSIEERRHILKEATNAVRNAEAKERAHYIENRLYDFMLSSEVLSIDGFVTFRLKEYRTLLKHAVEKAASGLLMEKEYAEFITLLQYFVSTQEPKEQLLHVVCTGEARFCLYNLVGEEIVLRTMDDVLCTETEQFTGEDLLLSALITLAPEKIILHHADDYIREEMRETIYKVFGGRVMSCKDCRICRKS